MFDYYKGINVTNSSTTVQCIYKDVCSSRHTKLCKDCKYNKECEKENKELTTIKE